MTMAASHNLNSKYEKDARPILLSSTASYNQCADRVIQHIFKCCCFIGVIITNVGLVLTLALAGTATAKTASRARADSRLGQQAHFGAGTTMGGDLCETGDAL